MEFIGQTQYGLGNYWKLLGSHALYRLLKYNSESTIVNYVNLQSTHSDILWQHAFLSGICFTCMLLLLCLNNLLGYYCTVFFCKSLLPTYNCTNKDFICNFSSSVVTHVKWYFVRYNSHLTHLVLSFLLITTFSFSIGVAFPVQLDF